MNDRRRPDRPVPSAPAAGASRPARRPARRLAGRPARRPVSRLVSRLVATLPGAAFAVAFGASVLGASPLHAGEADVVDGVVTPLGEGRYRIDATVRHDDTGWDHYADRWDVLGPDGAVLGSRELAHPHENEQPFTRSLTLEIPPGITRVTLRANDSVHGTGGATLELDVPPG